MAPIPELEDDAALHDDDMERDNLMKEMPIAAPIRKRNQSYKRKSTDDDDGCDEIVEEVKKRKSNPKVGVEQQQTKTTTTTTTATTTTDEEDDEIINPVEDLFQSPDIRRKPRTKQFQPPPNQQPIVTRKHKSLSNNGLDANTSFQTAPKKTNQTENTELPTITFFPEEGEKFIISSRNRPSSTSAISAFSIIASLVALVSVVFLLYIQYVPSSSTTTALNNNTTSPIINNATNNVNHSEIFQKLIETHSKQLKNNILDLVDTRLYELERKLNNNIRTSISSTSLSVKEVQQQELAKLKENIIVKISTEIDSILTQKLKSVNDINEQSINEIKGKIDTIIPGVKNLIDQSLDRYDADKIGLADYALGSLGSKIIEHSPSYSPSNFWTKLSGSTKTPDIILNSDTTIGNCWPMRGSSGFVVIEITHSIIPTSFSVDHVPKSLSPNISSAPKQISVFGYESETTLTKLAVFEYDVHGSAIQTFPVNESTTKKYKKFRFQISGNYGNSFYTCIYRFRIHGDRQAIMLKQ